MLQLAKWAIHTRGEDPAAVEEAIVGVYEAGRPPTKTTLGQWLDGLMPQQRRANATTGGPSKQDTKVRSYLEAGARLAAEAAAQQQTTSTDQNAIRRLP